MINGSTIVFEPADDLVIIDHAGFTKTFVVVQVCDAGHGDRFPDDRAINVAIGSAAIHCDVMPGSVNRCRDLTVTAVSRLPESQFASVT